MTNYTNLPCEAHITLTSSAMSNCNDNANISASINLRGQPRAMYSAHFEAQDDEVWGWQATDSSIALCLCIIKDSQSLESRHSGSKGPLWHGTGRLQPPETALLLSGWQLVTLAIVLQSGHPSSLAPYNDSGGVEPTGRSHGGCREHLVTLNDNHQPATGCRWT